MSVPGSQSSVQAAAPGPSRPFKSYFLSELLKAKVRLEGERRPAGRVSDIGARHTGMPCPLTACLEVKAARRTAGGGNMFVLWPDVVELSARQVVARKTAEAAPQVDFWLRRDVLDDQVVDVSGARAVRVNDIHLVHAEGQLLVGHAAVGTRAMLRRLGVEKPVRSLLRWLLDYTLKDSFVSWRNVELIFSGSSAEHVRVSAAPTHLDEIHPADLADILEQLGVEESRALLKRLSVETAADTLGEVDDEMQRALISREQPDRAADILEEMPAQEAAAVLRDLHLSDAQRIMSHMESEVAQDIKTVLAHRDRTAGAMMATFCIEARPQQHADEVLAHIRSVAERADVLNYTYVLDEQRRLVGVLGFRELLSAPPEATLESLMSTNLITVTPQSAMKDVARLFVRYGLRAIPVVDEQGVFLGAVRLLSALEELSPLFKE